MQIPTTDTITKNTTLFTAHAPATAIFMHTTAAAARNAYISAPLNRFNGKGGRINAILSLELKDKAENDIAYCACSESFQKQYRGS